MTKRLMDDWVIPPDHDAEFVAGMAEVLAVYAQPYDPDQPQVCMDEQPYQLLLETRVALPATCAHGERVDDEYERNGTASIFLFTEPLSGFRHVTARPRRTKEDWAREVAHLLDTHYAGRLIGSSKLMMPAQNSNVSIRSLSMDDALGALCANASEAVQAGYARLGSHMGMMAQLANDIQALAPIATEKTDIMLSRPTLPLMYTRHQLSDTIAGGDTPATRARLWNSASYLTWTIVETHRRQAYDLITQLTADAQIQAMLIKLLPTITWVEH